MASHLIQWIYCLKHYVLMALLCSSPKQLPNSIPCLALSLISYLLLGLLSANEQVSYFNIISQIFAEIILLGLITYTGLRLQNLLSRFHQTLSALIGISLVISIVVLSLYGLLLDNNASDQSLSSAEIYLFIAIFLWNLSVISLIFKRAFNIGTVASVMISISYAISYLFIIFWLN